MVVPKVLVANRGEIAVRVLRSARELGWQTVALYTTEPNLDASHATYADEVVRLDNVTQYMDANMIANIAARAQCTHVHPGYGFLSESPALENALTRLRPPIIFIGPSSDTLRLAGDKMLSRDLATSLGVQVAPGARADSSTDVRTFSAQPGVGFPVMIKALDGGGGRGIRVVNSASDVEEAFKRCSGESPSGQVFVEKALAGRGWKHIEVQVVGDGTGAVNHFWERECSVQRRFQKIVEVAPSRLPRSAIRPLVEASLKIAHHLKYKGLGTFEFLVNALTHDWVFLEINPRVQVEHTITEEVLDIDLIRAQLLLFHPSTPHTLSSLSFNNPPPIPTSTAIQLRLTSENPENSFLLSAGVIHSSEVQWPAGRGVRVDTWLSSSSPIISAWVIGTDFDSLLAKIIVRASSFEETTSKAKRVLRELTLGASGKVKTNINVLAGVLEHQNWMDGTIDTLWLERNIDSILSLGKSAIGTRTTGTMNLEEVLEQHQRKGQIFNASGSLPTAGGNILLQPGSLFHLTLAPSPMSSSTSGSQEIRKHTLTLTSIAHNAFPENLSGVIQSTLGPTPMSFSLAQSTSAAVGGGEGFDLADPNNPQHIAAPLTGKVVDVHSSFNDSSLREVKRGEVLIVMSVMKMETTVVAPHDGVVERVGRGLKRGIILGEGILVCILRPTGMSRL